MAVMNALPSDLIARLNRPSVINQWKFDDQPLNHGGSSTLNLRGGWVTPHNGL